MSQNDLSIANQGFASFRSDLNSALQALASTNSGTSAPSTTYANQLFYDTTNNILKIRNEDNDAFISLFTLDQTNDNIEALTIDGTLTYNGDLVSSTAGTSNFRAGVNAGNSIASGGNFNVTVGDEAGTALTTGDSNVAVGFEALKTEDTHSRNTAIGHQSLKTLNAGANAQSTAVGYNSAKAVTTGIENVFIGASAGETATTPNYTVAVGKSALGAVLTGDYNTAVGYHAGIASTSATLNTLVGAFSGDAITEGTTNCALGYLTLSAETTGQRNTAMGYSALANQNNTGGTQANNTAFGFFAGLNITTGVQNTFVGANAGDAQTVADNNTAVGFEALSTNANGSGSVAIGFRALKTQNYSSATDSLNVAVGNASGTAVTTGTKNTLIGHATGENQTDAGNNTFIGHKAGNAELRGHNSVAVGSNALLAQNTNSNTSIANTAVGYNAGKGITTGVRNIVIGASAGASGTGNMDTEQDNIIIGNDGGQNMSLNKNICIGQETNIQNHENSIVLGYNVDSVSSNTFTFGINDGANRVHCTFTGSATFTRVSDERYKEDIQNNTDCGLDFINDLRPITFKWKPKSKIDSSLPDYDKDKTEAEHKEKIYGLVAQEVKQALDKHSITDFDGWHLDERTGIQSISGEMFVMPLIKAVQELSTQVSALQAEVKKLKG